MKILLLKNIRILQEFLTRDYLLMNHRNMIVLIQPLDNSKNLKQI